jgi:hypothetical protein
MGRGHCNRLRPLTHVDFVYAIYFKLSPFLMGPAMQHYAHSEHFIALIALPIQFGFKRFGV